MTLRELLISAPSYPILVSYCNGIEFVVYDFNRETDALTYCVTPGYDEGSICQSYLGQVMYQPDDYVLVDYFDTDKRCECGSANVGSPAHSHWCPSFIQP